METRLLQLRVTGYAEKDVQRALEMLSKAWALPIIFNLEKNKETGFNQMKRILGGVTSKTLSKTLSDLIRNNLIERKVIPTRPPKVAYSLSNKGQELILLLEKISDWLERWREYNAQESLVLRSN